MGIIEVIFIVIFVICAFLLMALVLLQDEQGEGLGGIFGGGSSTPFGSRSGNVLTKFTSILGAIFLLTSLGLSWINSSTNAGDVAGAAAAARQESSAGAVDWWQPIGGSDADEAGTENPGVSPDGGAFSGTPE
ncbi:MAG: preprotein translocase subunit SecG [Spirochaetales bacterium]|nr:preprotein translocase subunit SecG [Spirochaetales bacterium]